MGNHKGKLGSLRSPMEKRESELRSKKHRSGQRWVKRDVGRERRKYKNSYVPNGQGIATLR
jgi:hypothetical protein